MEQATQKEILADPAEPRSSVFGELLAGAGMGLLVGVLVGLSISAVVGGVIAALTALVGALLGLSDKFTGPQGNRGDRVWRIGAFGCACAIAVVLGVALRANNWLGKSPRDRVAAWTAAGFARERALDFVAYSELGIAPKDLPPRQGQVPVGPGAGVLFTTSNTECSEMSGERFGNDDERLRAFDNMGRQWRVVANAVKSSDSTTKHEVLEAVWQIACRQANR